MPGLRSWEVFFLCYRSVSWCWKWTERWTHLECIARVELLFFAYGKPLLTQKSSVACRSGRFLLTLDMLRSGNVQGERCFLSVPESGENKPRFLLHWVTLIRGTTLSTDLSVLRACPAGHHPMGLLWIIIVFSPSETESRRQLRVPSNPWTRWTMRSLLTTETGPATLHSASSANSNFSASLCLTLPSSQTQQSPQFP